MRNWTSEQSTLYLSFSYSLKTPFCAVINYPIIKFCKDTSIHYKVFHVSRLKDFQAASLALFFTCSSVCTSFYQEQLFLFFFLALLDTYPQLYGYGCIALLVLSLEVLVPNMHWYPCTSPNLAWEWWKSPHSPCSLPESIILLVVPSLNSVCSYNFHKHNMAILNCFFRLMHG